MAASNRSREQILERIRAGLRAPALPLDDKSYAAEIFERVQNPLERFQVECKANLMETLLVADTDAVARGLSQILDTLPPGEIFVQDDPALRRVVESSGIKREVRWSSHGGPRETSQATITLADALVAQTGSVFLSASCGGRGASVVAPVHIVLARQSQLVLDLETALRDASAQHRMDNNSFACIISGSSRTADIEKILVQGAHGPIRLIVIVETGS